MAWMSTNLPLTNWSEDLEDILQHVGIRLGMKLYCSPEPDQITPGLVMVERFELDDKVSRGPYPQLGLFVAKVKLDGQTYFELADSTRLLLRTRHYVDIVYWLGGWRYCGTEQYFPPLIDQ